MKGISAVIAVVLILMITVALAAMAYVWFTGVFTTITNTTEQQVDIGAKQIATSFDVVSAGRDADILVGTGDAYIYVTNTGATNIDLENVNIIIGIKRVTNSSATGMLEPGATHEFIYGAISNSSCGEQVEVAYGNLERYTTLLCQ